MMPLAPPLDLMMSLAPPLDLMMLTLTVPSEVRDPVPPTLKTVVLLQESSVLSETLTTPKPDLMSKTTVPSESTNQEELTESSLPCMASNSKVLNTSRPFKLRTPHNNQEFSTELLISPLTISFDLNCDCKINLHL
jgi:hypothetical protein